MPAVIEAISFTHFCFLSILLPVQRTQPNRDIWKPMHPAVSGFRQTEKSTIASQS